MRNLNTVIFISGIDGAGKTTLAKEVVEKLREEGIEAAYIWYRWTALISYPLLLLCRLLGYTHRSKSLTLREYYRNKAIAFLWSFLYPFDYVFCSALKLLTFRQQDIIVIDRFVPDILVDVIFQTRINILDSFIGRVALSYLEKGNFKGVFIDIDEKTAMSRKDDIPFEEYVRFRRPIYLKLANAMGWKVLDGCRPPKKNVKEILRMMRVDPSG